MSKKKAKKKKLTPELAARKESICAALEAMRVTTVRVDWCGSGDSGQIEGVEARDEKQDVEVDLDKAKPVTIKKIVTESVDTGRKDKKGVSIYMDVKKEVIETVSLSEELCSFAEDLWEHFDLGGWYNDDGGHGELNINVKAREMQFTHSHYYTESEVCEDALI